MEGCQCGVLTATARDGMGPNGDRAGHYGQAIVGVSRMQERGLAVSVSAHSLEGRDESGQGVLVVPFPTLTLHEREERGNVPCLHGCRRKKRHVYVPTGDCRGRDKSGHGMKGMGTHELGGKVTGRTRTPKESGE